MKRILIFSLISFIVSCENDGVNYDAAGYFEADEVIVSAEQNGRILSLEIEEGEEVSANEVVGQIEVEGQKLQKEQILATKSSLKEKTGTATFQVEMARKQLSAQQAQLDHLRSERNRTSNLVKADAAPRKSLDDLDAQITQIQREMAVTQEQIKVYLDQSSTQNTNVMSQEEPLQKSADVIQYQIDKGSVVNPISGVVLTEYARTGELAMIGKPLYKVANLDRVNLKAYVSGDQLPQIQLGQKVKVQIDQGEDGFKTYEGIIQWISSESEFTPKTIQTKKERVNLVYAIKITVENDGFLKLGMYGEVLF